MDILSLKNLSVNYHDTQVLHEINLSIATGEIVGIVGESGSGKSTLLRAIARLLPRTATVTSGSICYDGKDIEKLSAKAMRFVRGNDLGFLFQNAESSFDPLFSIRSQFDEVLRTHKVMNSRFTYETIQRKALARVGLTECERILDSLPSELSGGMNQRVALAFALALEPQVLLADEPTSALDRASQQRVIEILASLNRTDELSILVVSHDMELVASLAHRIAVMREGRIVEIGSSDQVFNHPKNPYTQELISAIPHTEKSLEVIKLGGETYAS